MEIDDAAVRFELPDAEGGTATLAEGEPCVIVFTANHCPYALAWHDRLLAVARDYVPRGVSFVAISSNDAELFPDDSFEKMQERVAADGGWPLPYCFDESQDVARSYGATRTPEVFVFDAHSRLRYRGAPDADYERPELEAEWLRQAVEAILEGATPQPQRTEPVGCTIKWRDAA